MRRAWCIPCVMHGNTTETSGHVKLTAQRAGDARDAPQQCRNDTNNIDEEIGNKVDVDRTNPEEKGECMQWENWMQHATERKPDVCKQQHASHCTRFTNMRLLGLRVLILRRKTTIKEQSLIGQHRNPIIRPPPENSAINIPLVDPGFGIDWNRARAALLSPVDRVLFDWLINARALKSSLQIAVCLPRAFALYAPAEFPHYLVASLKTLSQPIPTTFPSMSRRPRGWPAININIIHARRCGVPNGTRNERKNTIDEKIAN